MRVEDHREHNFAVVTLDEEQLDAATSLTVKEQLLAVIEAGRGQLVLDLSRVVFIASAGIGMLVTVLKRIGMQGGLRLCGVQGQVASSLRLSRMDRVFPVFADVPAALASLD
jgi:anti-sigma B factor antagonist